MHTATLHVHPACASNRHMIERLQATTGRLVVVSGGKPRLSERKAPMPAPSATDFGPLGGDAA